MEHKKSRRKLHKKSGRKYRTPEAADYLGLSPSTMAKMRCNGGGPPYSKAGPRVVVYDPDDLDDYIAGRRLSSTSDQIAA